MKSTHVGLIRLTAMSLVGLAVSEQVGAAGPQTTLVEEVRRATARFSDVAAAGPAGYAPFLGASVGRRRERWGFTTSMAIWSATA
jgi:hypothetical protein